MGKIKDYFKKKKVVWSDILFTLGSLITLVFVWFEQFFEKGPNTIPLSIGWILAIFYFAIICFAIVFFLERSNRNLTNPLITIVFILLMMASVTSILIQPRDFVLDRVIGSSIITTEFRISGTHMLFYACERILLLAMLYFGLFVFPKRYKSKKIINWVCYTILVFVLFTLVYSYITEYDKYYPAIKGLFDEEPGTVEYLESIIGNRNGFAMVLLFGMCACFILHSTTRKWWWIILPIYLYWSILITCCKSSILLGVCLIVFYYYFALISMFRKHKIRNSILITIFSVIVFGVAYVVFLSVASGGNVLPFIDAMVKDYTSGATIKSRMEIWQNTFLLIEQEPIIYWLLGRGHGLVNEMICEIYQGQELFSIHNSYVAFIGNGGLPLLAMYLILFVYSIVLSFRYLKRNYKVTMTILMCLIIFSVYCMVETIHPICYILFFMLIVYFKTTKKEVLIEKGLA